MPERDGVVYCEEPMEVNYIDFGYEHLGCDSIITAESADTEENSTIVAYASSPEFNRRLREVFRERFDGGRYVMMKHISEVQAHGIF